MAWIGDDDFQVPASLEKCALFLEERREFSTAHGVAMVFVLGSSSVYGGITSSAGYFQRSVEHATATERLMDYLANYFVTRFSVHRTADFQMAVAAGEAYNIEGTTPITVGDFLALLIQRSKVSIRTCLNDALLRPADVTLQIPCVEKFRQATRWTPHLTFEETVDYLLSYWREEVGRESRRSGSSLRTQSLP
jgi:hypothetical protein